MKLLRNSLYSLFGSALPMVLSIVTVPFYITAIGSERYGVLAIAWLVLGYFGATDFGIGRAITQRISSMRSKEQAGTPAMMASAVWSALISMLGLGVVGALLVYGSTYWYFSGPFDVADALRVEIVAALWILAICNPAMAISGVLSGALVGLERFRLVSFVHVVSSSALILFPLMAAWTFGAAVSILILASLTARLLGAIVLAVGVWHAFLRGQAVAFSMEEFARLANFGAWIMVTSLVGPLMVYADRLVIGALLGAVAVAAYTIPFQVAIRTLMLPFAVVQALFPRFASDESEVSKERCRDYSVFVGQMFAPLAIGIICLSAPLLSLWLGDTLDVRSIMVAQIVMAGFWINSVASVTFAYIQARGNSRFTGLLHMVELPIYFGLLFLFGTRFGLAGYAAAFALRCALDCWVLAHKAGIANRSLVLRLLLPTLLVLASLVAGYSITDWLHLLGMAMLLSGLAIICGVAAMPDSIRARLRQLPLLRGRAGLILNLGRGFGF